MKRKVFSKRRHGAVIVYVALALVVLMGAAGLSIDVGNLYLRRDKAQSTADAAALAGALKLMAGSNKAGADARAKDIATNNGYDTTAGATFASVINPDGAHASYYQVHVTRPEPVFFMAIFGWRSKTIGAQATATYEVPVDFDINGGGEYGKNGPVTLSMFGPYAQHTYGDCYSTMYLQNNSPNPLYEKDGQYGYDFKIGIPKNYNAINGSNKVDLQIFDPDTYNGNGSADAVQDYSMDEIRTPQGGNPLTSSVDGTANFDQNNTTTRYRLYDTKGTDDTSDDTLIAEATYGADSTTDMLWVTPTGFTFNINDSRWASRFAASGSNPVDFRLNIKSINGSSENGFNLRAGPPIPTFQQTRLNSSGGREFYYDPKGSQPLGWYADPFDPNNGSNVTATGRIPMNFNASGAATIKLGHVAAGATHVSINKFDTDVGAQSVTYNDGISTRTGVLSGGDAFYQDDYDLPANYAGGDWSATYTAGTGDTSVWDMSYQGPKGNNPGGVHLVK